MSKNYVSSSAQCPFYEEESRHRDAVICEGVTDHSRIHLAFTGERAARRYREWHCYGDYKECPIYKMQMERYASKGA